MTASLVLHIGAMKTGTTYVQELLAANADPLGVAGWWVPPQQRVVRSVRELLAHAAGTGPEPRRWRRLLDDVRSQGEGRGTLVSMEFLSHARRPWLPAVTDGLDGLDLRVVLTARDTATAVPAQWQSLVRNGYPLSWPEFAAGVAASADDPRTPGAGSFRRTQDLPRMLRLWGEVVPPERFAVVTVPTSGAPRDLLWHRFLEAAGVEAPTTTGAAFDNPQLGYASCEALRRVNAAGLGSEPPPLYRRVVRRLTRERLFELRGLETRPLPDAGLAAFAAAQNERVLAAVARHAFLVGEAADLPTTPAEAAEHPPDPPERDVRRATGSLHAGAVALCAEQGLDLPADLSGDLPDEVGRAALQVATVMAIAMRGDLSHRPTPRRAG